MKYDELVGYAFRPYGCFGRTLVLHFGVSRFPCINAGFVFLILHRCVFNGAFLSFSNRCCEKVTTYSLKYVPLWRSGGGCLNRFLKFTRDSSIQQVPVRYKLIYCGASEYLLNCLVVILVCVHYNVPRNLLLRNNTGHSHGFYRSHTRSSTSW